MATILVVDDDLRLLRLTERMLIAGGYTVRCAISAEEAWPIIEADATIDLLLADIVLPGESGVQLAERMLAIRPAVKVLYMSGYTDWGLGAVALKAVEAQLLRKPFTAAQVKGMVGSALGRPERPAPEPKPRG
jgi:DNA-binding NtrC family response regulator